MFDKANCTGWKGMVSDWNLLWLLLRGHTCLLDRCAFQQERDEVIKMLLRLEFTAYPVGVDDLGCEVDPRDAGMMVIIMMEYTEGTRRPNVWLEMGKE